MSNVDKASAKSAPIKIESFSHVAMQVSDLNASIAFYRDLLGLEMVMETRPEDFPEGAPKVHVVGCLAGGNVIIEFGEGLGPPGPVKTEGSPVLAFAVADIEATHQALLTAEVKVTMPPREMMPGLFMLFIQDPDGRTIELAQFPDGARSNAEYNLARNARAGTAESDGAG